MKKPQVEKIKEILKSKGIQPSVQRVKILEYLMNTRSHPSADEIFQALSSELPTLSKTTVYNTLEAFMKIGIIKPVYIDSRELRIDAFTHPHAHFKCTTCGKIFDIEIEMPDFVSKKTNEGHLVQTQDLYLEGTCAECLRKEEK
jgi:Fur family peroxide stress response transcriptional regulator